MLLREWIEGQGRGAITRLARKTGLSYTAVLSSVHGTQAKRYPTAKLISDATGGEVSIAELCEPPPSGHAAAPGPSSAGASQ